MSHARISHYELLERLGAGGMGVVYKARDTKLERLVSVKLLRPELVADPERVQRFLHEAKTASGLNHPSITTIHQLGEFEGRHFITMEYVDGENLRDRLQKGPLPVRQILDIGTHVAEGLAVAHAAGVVHRDLKPENVMVRSDGLVKILDFGLAKLLEGEDRSRARLAGASAGDETLVHPLYGSPGSSASSSEPTLPGLVMGTVGYMSPEQVRGEPVDARSDVFALGAVLYELASGLKPFGRGSPIEVMHAILKEQPPSLHQRRPDLPAELERLLRKALAKDPEERYQSAKELAIDLRALRREIDSGSLVAAYAAPSGPLPRLAARRGRLFVGIAIVVVLAALATVIRVRGGARAGGMPTLQVTRLTATGEAASPAVSPDARHAAYVVSNAGRQSIWLRQLGTGSTVQLVPPGESGLEGLVFSPDANWLYYLSWPRGTLIRTLYRIPTLGGTPRRVYEDVDTPVSFSPDGGRIVFTRLVPPFGGRLLVGDAAGASELQEIAGMSDLEYMHPQWSPDGKRIAVSMRSVQNPLTVGLALLPAAGGEPTRLGDATWSEVAQLSWTPPGNDIVVSGIEQGQSGSFQLYAVHVSDGAVRQITTDLNGYRGVSQSADGRTLVSAQRLSVTNLWRVPAAGSPVHNTLAALELTSGTAHVSGPSVSPDGRYIAYVTDATGNLDIWIMGIDGGAPRQITSGPASEFAPEWSPDGRRIAYTARTADSVQVWVMDADGSDARALTHDGVCVRPSWSADGRWLVYSRRDGAPWGIWKVPVEGGPPVEVASGWVFGARWSPDGRTIGYWEVLPDTILTPRFKLMPAGGGAPRTLEIPFDFKLAGWVWRPDSRAITTLSASEGATNLVNFALDGGAPLPLTDFAAGPGIYSWAWLPDGSAIVCERGTPRDDVVLLQPPSRPPS